jgi:copper(I)-binding protein
MSHPGLGRRLFVVGLFVLTSASATPPRITVSGAWTRPAAAGMNAAGYLTVANQGRFQDRLTGAASPIAARVTLHQSHMVGNVSVMRALDGIAVASRGQINLAPGGFHLMLEGLKRPLRPGERAPVTLQFQRAGPVRAWLTVRNGPPAATGMKM